MYNDIYSTNKHAFRDGFLVGVVATIAAIVITKKLTDPEPYVEPVRD